MGEFDYLVPKQGSTAQTNEFAQYIPKNPDPLRGIKHGVKQFARSAADNASWVAQNPLANGVGAVLGTTERFGSGLVSDLLDQAAGRKPRTNAFKNVMSPQDDEKVTHRLEHQELTGPLNWWNSHTPEKFLGQSIHGHFPTKNEPWKQAGLDFLTQTGHDLSTFIPGADIISIGSRLVRLTRAAHAAQAAARTVGKVIPQTVKDTVANTVEHAKSNLSTSHDALKGLQQPGLNLVRAREGGARHLHQQRLDEYRPAIEQHKPGIESLDASLRANNMTGTDLKSIHKTLQLPLADRLTLAKANKVTDKALWRDATPEARRQMLARGYKPGPDEIGLPTTNLVSRDFGRRYIPEQTLYDKDAAKAADAMKGFSYNRGGVKRSAFDKTKSGAGSQDPLYDRFMNRLESSAYLEPKRRAEQTIIQDLGLTPSNAPRTSERLEDLKQRLDLTRKSDPAYAQIKKSIDRYSGLLGKQTQSTYENTLKQDKYLKPGAATAPDKVKGVLSGENAANQRAARDLKFLGNKTVDKAFDQFGNLKSNIDSGVLAERARNRLGEDTRTLRSERAARGAVRVALGRYGKDVDRAKSAVDSGKTILEKQAEKGYTAGIKSDQDLLSSLKNTPGLSQEKEVGYRRSGGGIQDNYDVEKQTLLNRRGESIRGKIDPAFRALLDATKKESTDKPFEAVSSALGRIGKGVNVKTKKGVKVRGSAEKTLADLLNRNASVTGTRTKAALQAHDAYRQLLEQNQAVRDVSQRAGQDRFHTGDIDLPQVLHDRLFGDKARVQPGVAAKLGQGLAGVMFSNPAPHLLGNIGEQQTFAGGGPRALLGGAAEAIRLARKDPKAIDRLNQSKAVGAQYERGYESGEQATHPLGKAYNSLQRGLTLGHEGQASELFQRYVKAGHTPEDAAEEVRKTFGRPYESSKESKAFNGVGAQFFNWLSSTVPRSAKKAVGSVQGRNALKNYSRGVEDVNADVFEPQYGVEFNPGGFASRMASLAFRPVSYLASQSADDSLHGFASEAKTNLNDVAKSVIPYYGPASDLIGQPLTPKQRMRGGYKKLPWYLKIPTLAGGYYTHAETPHQKLMRELKRDGLR
jgi:hypothetical protein